MPFFRIVSCFLSGLLFASLSVVARAESLPTAFTTALRQAGIPLSLQALPLQVVDDRLQMRFVRLLAPERFEHELEFTPPTNAWIARDVRQDAGGIAGEIVGRCSSGRHVAVSK